MLPYVAGNRNRFAQQLFTPLPQRYDRLAELLSMGQNGRWRTAQDCLGQRGICHAPGGPANPRLGRLERRSRPLQQER